MKFKQQEETVKNNPLLESVIDLLSLNRAFQYAVDCFNKKRDIRLVNYSSDLCFDWKDLMKLAISLNPEHKEPIIDVELKVVNSIAELKALEEKYYNMLKEVGKNALEAGDFVGISHLGHIVRRFEHYFCTLDENDNSGETSS